VRETQVPDSELCQKCGKSRSLGNGSLTQWLVGGSACKCSSLPLSAVAGMEVTKLCSTCGKAVPDGRQGSMTQWIFRVDTCKCSTPTIMFRGEDGTGPTPIPLASNDTRFGAASTDEPAIDVESDKFPADRYRALEELGHGSSGIVFRAKDMFLNRIVAIKSVRTSTQLTAEQILQFQREAKATSQLEHRNLISVFDFGVTNGGVPYLVMEYFRGKTLAELIEMEGALPLSVAVPLMIEICRGMEHAHQRGVLHRDLKSNNVLLVPPEHDEFWSCKIIDFGLAALPATSIDGYKTKEGAMMGSPPYMSPEQVRGLDVDERSDIYSLGCILFECLTGRVPFEGDSALTTMMMHLEQEAPLVSDLKEDLDCAAELDRIVSKSLEKRPADRFQTVTELKEELKNLLILAESQRNSARRKQALEETFSAVLAEVQKGEAKNRSKMLYGGLFATVVSVLLVVLGLNYVREHSKPKNEPHIKPTIPHEKDFFGLPPVPEGTELNVTPGVPRAQRFVPPALRKTDLQIRQDNLLSENARLYFLGESIKSGVGTTDETLSGLKDPTLYPAASRVNLRGTNVSGPGLKYLKGRPIEDIDLGENKLSAEAIPMLAALRGLKCLCLNHSILPAQVSFAPLKATNLNELTIADAKVDDRIVADIATLGTISNLNLQANPAITDASVPALLKMTKLVSLDVSDTSITARGLVELLKLPAIRNLNTADIPITDNEFNDLVNALQKSSLRGLTLDCRILSDKAFLNILSLKRPLSHLDCRSADNISASTKRKIQKSWPSCVFQDSQPIYHDI
jgi:serine/threonine protein kinase